MADNPRPLVIVDRFPLPAVTGGRQRMWNFLHAIDAAGPADLLVLESPDDEAADLIRSKLPSWNCQFQAVPRRGGSKLKRLAVILQQREPSGLARFDFAALATTTSVVAEGRQLIIAIQPIAAVLAQRIRSEETSLLVDLWDIEDARLRRLMTIREPGARVTFPRRAWNWVRNSSDVRAWRRFHESLLDIKVLVTVCSDVDRHALPAGLKVRVVPNGADLRSLSAHAVGDPPVILFHGQLTYQPNADAARILVDEILPLVRHQIPDVRVRIVGRADNRLTDLASPPSVTVTGFVDDIELELANADILVVPLRVGGGTRLKILEAFSAGLPVVSTRIGAEGIDVIDRRHLLLADSPAQIAAAVHEMLTDRSLRELLRREAHALVVAKYDWRIIREDVTDLVRQMA